MLFLMLTAGRLSWAIDWQDEQAFKKTINLSWIHYQGLGHLDFNLRTDHQLREIRQIGLGHWFDQFKFGLYMSTNKPVPNNSYELGYKLRKDFLEDRYTILFSYQPLTNDKRYYFTGQITDNLYLQVAYSTYTENWNIGGIWKIRDNLNFNAQATERQDTWEFFTGLNITFTSGNRKVKKAPVTKEIQWLDDTGSAN